MTKCKNDKIINKLNEAIKDAAGNYDAIVIVVMPTNGGNYSSIYRNGDNKDLSGSLAFALTKLANEDSYIKASISTAFGFIWGLDSDDVIDFLEEKGSN